MLAKELQHSGGQFQNYEPVLHINMNSFDLVE